MQRMGFAMAVGVLLLAACREAAPPPAACPECATVVIAAVREPATVLPPLVLETVGRDIGDRVFERLAVLRPGAATIDPDGFRPALAERWERLDSLRWRFTLRRGARWHDGQPVTAADVAFSFAAAADPSLGGLSVLEGVTVHAADDGTVEVAFPRAYAEQLYDATYHVRILPQHVWGAVPASGWAADTALARLVGSGPYRLSAWRRGESLTLEADTSSGTPPAIRRLVWRFTSDPDAALNLVLSHEADLLESVGSDAAAARVAADSSYRLLAYPAAVYGFAGFKVADRSGAPHRLFGDRAVRRALTMAVDRPALATALVGSGARVPDGPMSPLLWIGGDGTRAAALPFDTASAARSLDDAGWRPGRDGVRARAGTPLAFDILVPSTSPVRRQLAEALQAAWQRVGARVTVTAVDFPVFQQRLGDGRFDVYVGAYLDEPSPRGLVEQWTARGIGALNHGRWVNPLVDSLMAAALAAPSLAEARRLWGGALDALVADAPAVFLYTPEQRAAVHRRIAVTALDPFSWLEGVERWEVRGPR